MKWTNLGFTTNNLVLSDEVFLREYSEKKEKKSICFLIDKNVLTQVSSYNVDKETYILSRKKYFSRGFHNLKSKNLLLTPNNVMHCLEFSFKTYYDIPCL